MNQDHQLIEDYLSGKLTPEGKAAVEQRLTNDLAFAEVFQIERSMNTFLVKEGNKADLIPKLENLGKKHFDQTQAKSIKMKRRRILTGLAVAASFALLIFSLNQLFEKSLYEQYAVHQPLNLIEKSESAPIAGKAQEQFNNKNYQAAYESLSAYLEESPDDTKALLARGISALELDQYEEALTIFRQINEGSSVYQSTATWYLALSHVRQENFEKAKEYLLQIPSSEGAIYEDAQELMERLR